ncbi:MAG: T9SS type A sorting domain-containing protein, partial [Bacteroidota bacterium]
SLNTNQIISTSDLNDGVYMIAVQNNQQHVITKLIINK